MRKESTKLAGRQHVGDAETLCRATHLCDRVRLHPLLPDRMVEQCRHEIADFASRAGSVGQGCEPALDVDRPHSLKPHALPHFGIT